MVACEEELLLEEQGHTAARVSRERNDEEVVGQADVFATFDETFNARRQEGTGVCGVDDALAAEASRVFAMVGDVVLMRQEHEPDATELFDSVHQRACR